MFQTFGCVLIFSSPVRRTESYSDTPGVSVSVSVSVKMFKFLVQVIYFWDTDTPNVALRDPKVNRTRGNLHMKAHENLTTQDESVKRGGGSVTVVEIHRTPFRFPRDQLCR